MKKLLTPIEVLFLFISCEKTEYFEPIHTYELKIDSVLNQIKEYDIMNDKSILQEQSKSQSCTRHDAEIYRVMLYFYTKGYPLYKF